MTNNNISYNGTITGGVGINYLNDTSSNNMINNNDNDNVPNGFQIVGDTGISGNLHVGGQISGSSYDNVHVTQHFVIPIYEQHPSDPTIGEIYLNINSNKVYVFTMHGWKYFNLL